MGFSPFFGERDRLIFRYIAAKPNRDRGSWRNESDGQEFYFHDNSHASDQAFSAATASYVQTLSQVAATLGVSMRDIQGKISSEDW